MKKIIALIVAVLFVFAVASVSFAADKAAPAAEKRLRRQRLKRRLQQR